LLRSIQHFENAADNVEGVFAVLLAKTCCASFRGELLLEGGEGGDEGKHILELSFFPFFWRIGDSMHMAGFLLKLLQRLWIRPARLGRSSRKLRKVQGIGAYSLQMGHACCGEDRFSN
jgi:hypothetical protein